MLRVYFAGSISQSRADLDQYMRIIEMLGDDYQISSDAADAELFQHEAHLSNREIYQQEMRELGQSDVMIAEVSEASLGVGYQIAHAERLGKPILCLTRPGDRISPMLIGSARIEVGLYDTLDEADTLVQEFLVRHGFREPTLGEETLPGLDPAIPSDESETSS
jgi:nucleoside 2-deoxyribosyltransferase